MFGTEQMTSKQAFEMYKSDIEKLIAYLPWLETVSSKRKVASFYTGEDVGAKSLPFPVYDGNLLRFIKDAENTAFISRNYVYVITANRLRTPLDDKKFVCAQGMLGLDKIGAVLSKYVLGGRVKAVLWAQAVDECVFLEIVTRLKELYDEGMNS